MRHASLSISEGVEETIAEYRAILGDLERRESEAAKEAMRDHSLNGLAENWTLQ